MILMSAICQQVNREKQLKREEEKKMFQRQIFKKRTRQRPRDKYRDSANKRQRKKTVKKAVKEDFSGFGTAGHCGDKRGPVGKGTV